MNTKSAESASALHSSDSQSAAKLLQEAQACEANDEGKAFDLYEKAFAADPRNGSVILKLVDLSIRQRNGFAAHNYLNTYIESHPSDWERRRLRLRINDGLLRMIQENSGSLSGDQAQEAKASIIPQLDYETKLDQAVILAHTFAEQWDLLQKQKEKLWGFSKRQVREKRETVQYIHSTAAKLAILIRLPKDSQENLDFVERQLTKLVVEAYVILSDFAKEDGDVAVAKRAPLFEAYRLLALGKNAEAVAPLEIFQSTGFKTLGNNDEAKGEEIFLMIFQEAKALGRAKKMEEAKRKLSLLPAGLLDTYQTLKIIKGQAGS